MNFSSNMENKIKILSPPLLERESISLRNFRKYCMKKIETEINHSGGIGGFPIEIQNLLIKKTEIGEINNISQDMKIFEHYYRSSNAQIILDIPNAFFREIPNFFKKFNGLSFSHCDPVDKFKHRRLFDTNNEFFDNRKTVSFFANHLLPSSILLFQDSYYANDSSFKRYEVSLRQNGFKGDFKKFSLKEDDEKLLLNDKNNQSNHLILKISKLLKALPKNSLVILNVHYSEQIFKIVRQLSESKNINVVKLTLGDSSNEEEYLFTHSLNQDLELQDRISSFVSEGKIKIESLPPFEEITNIYYTALIPVYLCQYAVNSTGKKFETSIDVIDKLPELINNLDGERDTFLHLGNNYSFKDNKLVNKETFAFRRIYIDQIKGFENVYFEIQPGDKQQIKEVMFVYLDLIKVEEINISKNYWISEFELEVNSSIGEPIEFIRFENRAELIDIWNIKKVNEYKINKRFQTKYRIAGAFDFKAEIAEFPFDRQKLTIEISLDSKSQNQILQPPINSIVDTEFLINGWNIIGAKSGTLSRKNFDRVGSALQTKVQVKKINKTEWKVARRNNVAVLRSLIPLLVMILLSWYSSFFDFSKAITTVQLNTTVFLAGVALYFSAEKPNGSKFTLIDKLFIYFYFAIGLLILSEFSVLVSEELYKFTHLIWQISIPCLIFVLLTNLWNKYKNLTKK